MSNSWLAKDAGSVFAQHQLFCMILGWGWAPSWVWGWRNPTAQPKSLCFCFQPTPKLWESLLKGKYCWALTSPPPPPFMKHEEESGQREVFLIWGPSVWWLAWFTVKLWSSRKDDLIVIKNNRPTNDVSLAMEWNTWHNRWDSLSEISPAYPLNIDNMLGGVKRVIPINTNA